MTSGTPIGSAAAATITTIIPTFQRPQLLRRAIASVLAQTYANFRVCVYDNASGDETARIVADLMAKDARIAYCSHPRNIGLIANFTQAMARVETPFFSVLCDDDVLFPEFFETALSGFARHPAAMLSICSTLEFDESGELLYVPLSAWPRAGLFEPPEGAFLMLGNRHPTLTSILIRREALDRVGPFDEAVGLPADLDFELRVAVRYPIVVSFRPCGAFVRHANSASLYENPSVVLGYGKMLDNVVGDNTIDRRVRHRLARCLNSQARRKLLEIAVKSLVRRDFGVAGDAATLLRDRFRRPATGYALQALRWLCERARAFHELLARLESARLRLRARASRGASSMAGSCFNSYARYLRLPGPNGGT